MANLYYIYNAYQFRITNNVYAAAENLGKRFNFEVDPCAFCTKEAETTEHLFFSFSSTAVLAGCH